MSLYTTTVPEYKRGPFSAHIPEGITDPEFFFVLMSGDPASRPAFFWTEKQPKVAERPETLNIVWSAAFSLNSNSSSLAPFVVMKSAPGVTQSIIGEPFVTVEWKFAPFTELWREELSSATTHPEYPEEIRLTLGDLLADAREEAFEDGMESQFSKSLISYIKRYGNAAVQVLTEYVLSKHVNAEIASEILRWIGHIEDVSTIESRLWLLGRSLLSPSSRVRDAATLGIAFLNDPQAIPLLEAAIERERIQELREDMEQILEDLRHPTLCH